jgi:hypothetical protein
MRKREKSDVGSRLLMEERPLNFTRPNELHVKNAAVSRSGCS